MADDFLRAFISFFAIIGPTSNILIFHVFSRRLAPRERVAMALLSVGVAFAMIVAFSLGGETVLDYLNISNESFQVAAGALLVLPALRLVEKGEPMEVTEEENRLGPFQLAVVPLATPLLAGPGALAAAISFSSDIGSGTTLLAAAVVLGLAFLGFSAAGWVFRIVGPSILRLLSRIVGIILAAVAADFILEGLSAIFNGNL